MVEQGANRLKKDQGHHKEAQWLGRRNDQVGFLHVSKNISLKGFQNPFQKQPMQEQSDDIYSRAGGSVVTGAPR